jgi:tetratricopeptide (TPR) repeat protein
MNDTILLDQSDKEFARLVSMALKACRDGQLLELATSPLAQSSLVTGCFLSDEPVTLDGRGRALMAVLYWAVERLRPAGEAHWTAHPWRFYLLLHHFYLRGMRVSELAEQMAVVEQTLYDTRPAAFSAVAGVLRQELSTPQDVDGRKQQYIALRYTSLLPTEQVILRCAAIFRHPIDMGLLEEMLRRSEPALKMEPAFNLSRLIDNHLLISNDEHSVVMVHPEIRIYLLGLLTPTQRRVWHETAARSAGEIGDYLDAAIHFRQAGMLRSAAELLVSHQREIVDNMQGEELRSMLGEFRQAELSEATWVQMKIIAGGLAEMMQDVDTAAAEYGKALNARDLESKALAYYRRARVLESKNLDEALAHYQYCISLLEANESLPMLLVKAYIDQAWIYIQERPDLDRAHSLLERASSLVKQSDRESWSQLQNAWGDWYYHQGHMKEAVEHHQQGWLAANEIQNLELMLNSAHNLGTVYTELGESALALDYLRKAQQIAQQSGNRKMEAMCNKSLGACYFWMKEYDQAIGCYTLAREVYIEMGNRNRQASACYDLAEAYAAMGDVPAGRKYFQEGSNVAQELGLERYQRSFAELAQNYVELLPPEINLSVRQQRILEHVRENGEIKSDQCASLIEVSKEQAIRDLNDLIDKGLLSRQGRARNTSYVIPPK